ncbi:MAG TPA: metal ABC transporter substrate-binding protein [Oscillatoriaceae cyanobacterium]
MRQLLFAATAAALLTLSLSAPRAQASGRVNVVTTTEDLAAIAQAIGGDHVNAYSLSHGYNDIHFYEARPSDVMKIRRAQVFCEMGLALDSVWDRPLLDAAQNNDMVRVNCSTGLNVLEKPTGQVNMAMGDVHPYGNPHYQMDPESGKVIAANIESALEQVDPNDASTFAANEKKFDAELDAKMKVWTKEMAPLRGANFFDYHKEFTYFAHRFGLNIVGNVEPKPGVPPTPSHTLDLIRIAKHEHVRATIVEQWFNTETPAMIQREAGVPYVVIPTSVGGYPQIKTYFDLFDYVIPRLVAAAKQ